MVAKELNLGEQALGTSVKKERSRRGPDGEPTEAMDESDSEVLKRLRKEVFELRKDNRFRGKPPPSSRRSNIGRTVRTDARVEG